MRGKVAKEIRRFVKATSPPEAQKEEIKEMKKLWKEDKKK